MWKYIVCQNREDIAIILFIFANSQLMIYFAEFIFAIDHVMVNFAEFNFAKWGQNRKNKFRKNFFRKNFFRKKILPLR